MNDLHEIVDLNSVNRIFGWLAILLPIAGFAIGYMSGKSDGRIAKALQGLLWGSLGVLNWLMWRLYNALTDRNGLDSVFNVGINLVIFLGAGILAGIGFSLLARNRQRQIDSESELSQTPVNTNL